MIKKIERRIYHGDKLEYNKEIYLFGFKLFSYVSHNNYPADVKSISDEQKTETAKVGFNK